MMIFKNIFKEFFLSMIQNIKQPLLFFIVTLFIYLIFSFFNIFYPNFLNYHLWINVSALACGMKSLNLIALLWLVWRFLQGIHFYLQNYTNTIENQRLKLLIPLMGHGIRIMIILFMVHVLIPWMDVNASLEAVLKKSANLLMIGLLGWLFFKIVHAVEKLILLQYGGEEENSLAMRKIKTQLLILKRVILGLSYLVILSAFLLNFQNLHSLGTGLLTVTGFIGAIGAFASQQSLNRLFSGLQLAFTQPIRIGETVVIENETGTIEEISLFYIVIKLWDGRRLILPTDALMAKSLQNLSRSTTNLLGSVLLQADYTLPIPPLREKFLSILKESRFWDQSVGSLQVIEMHPATMEIRALMSASNTGKLWELRCEVREKLIAFIVENYSHALPKIRNIGL